MDGQLPHMTEGVMFIPAANATYYPTLVIPGRTGPTAINADTTTATTTASLSGFFLHDRQSTLTIITGMFVPGTVTATETVQFAVGGTNVTPVMQARQRTELWLPIKGGWSVTKGGSAVGVWIQFLYCLQSNNG
jgi:hypothetical protein